MKVLEITLPPTKYKPLSIKIHDIERIDTMPIGLWGVYCGPDYVGIEYDEIEYDEVNGCNKEDTKQFLRKVVKETAETTSMSEIDINLMWDDIIVNLIRASNQYKKRIIAFVNTNGVGSRIILYI